MSLDRAEREFSKGKRALREGRIEDASALFRTAVALDKEDGGSSSRMRYMSYCGLTAALAGRPTPEAIRACEVAAREDFLVPEMHLNLGRIYQLAGKTGLALQAFERGLKFHPQHSQLQRALTGADRRGHPPLPLFKRSHPINRLLGRWRHMLLIRRTRRSCMGS